MGTIEEAFLMVVENQASSRRELWFATLAITTEAFESDGATMGSFAILTTFVYRSHSSPNGLTRRRSDLVFAPYNRSKFCYFVVCLYSRNIVCGLFCSRFKVLHGQVEPRGSFI